MYLKGVCNTHTNRQRNTELIQKAQYRQKCIMMKVYFVAYSMLWLKKREETKKIEVVELGSTEYETTMPTISEVQ